MKEPDVDVFAAEVERLAKARLEPKLVFRFTLKEFISMAATMGDDWRDVLLLHAVEAHAAEIENGDTYIVRTFPEGVRVVKCGVTAKTKGRAHRSCSGGCDGKTHEDKTIGKRFTVVEGRAVDV